MGYWTDENFQDKLVSHLIQDRRFLKASARLLKTDDFKPKASSPGWERWILAGLALDYWEKYRHPVNKLITAEIEDYARSNRTGDKLKAKLLLKAKDFLKQSMEASAVIADKVIRFKKDKRKIEVLQEMIDLQEKGQLTDDEMVKLSRKALDVLENSRYNVYELFTEKEITNRLARRRHQGDVDIPVLLVDPMDSRIRAIGRKQLGLIAAPEKRAKSLALIWLTIAYTVQGLNSVYVTCEDPQNFVEDRFDAAVSGVLMKKLTSMPRTVEGRLRRFKAMLRGRLRVVDATDGQCSLSWLETMARDFADEGFPVDVLIVDYDDEIVPPTKHKGESARRMEFGDVYRGLRQLASRMDLICWTAAQCKRNTREKKILTDDDLAEDISKARKAHIVITIGKGGDDEDHLFLWVAAHKTDRMNFGVNIFSARARGLFYDRERTRRWLAQRKAVRAQREATA